MKNKYLIIVLIGLILGLVNIKGFGQDKTVDFSIGSNGIIYSTGLCGEDNFYVVYGKMLISNNATKNIMMFDKDLKPLWDKPFSFTGAQAGNINVFSFTNSVDKKTTSYIFGGEQFIQLLPDGTVKEKKTLIPEKELEFTASVFVDSIGLNIITLTGDNKYGTGKMKWYTFTHDQLSKKEKSIELEKPENINDEYESGWRLNCVSPTGLYFYFVVYKREIKETGRPILACNIVKVDYSGKSGEIINLDLGADKYNIIPAEYNTKYENQLVLYPKSLFVIAKEYKGSEKSDAYIFDITTMGLVIDEKAKKIYTCYASNDELKVSNNGFPKDESLNNPYLIKDLNINVFDFTGQDISKSKPNIFPLVFKESKSPSYGSNNINLLPLQSGEGFIWQATNNEDGYFSILNNDGEQMEQGQFTLFEYKEMTAIFTIDKFSSIYSSLDDFKNSPYYLGLKSPVNQYFNKIDKKKQKYVNYVSLKSGHVLIEGDGKADKVKINFFAKK